MALLRAELANGMHKKPIEALATEIHDEPLPPEARAVIIAARARVGMAPPAAIKAMILGAELEATECPTT